MARWYSKRRKTKLSKVIKQGKWLKYCGFRFWYGRDLICSPSSCMCYDCSLENYPSEYDYEK